MINWLKGHIESIDGNEMTLNVSGVGYQIFCSAYSIHQLKSLDPCMVYTHMHVREDAQLLYGFSAPEEKRIFLLLGSVSGIGPKSAIQMLSNISYPDLVQAVLTNNIVALVAIPGVGKKTAERMIIECKDKLLKLGFSGSSIDKNVQNVGSMIMSENVLAFDEAVEALVELGFSLQEAKNKIKIIPNLTGTESVEILIKLALRH